ncbi:odorant receptor 9a-like [Leptopilina boulardi]|uniref:odorant receptor 9a-like n=1 Tax=Leptopilina boulardi TaxID=63433 RepID=UPI0021F5BEDF|nr:odorant receptor 9a-like [Leptopilina boulardi]
MNQLCQPRDKFENEILQQSSHYCRLYTIIYLTLTNLSAMSFFIFSPSKKNNFKLPFKVWIPYSLNSRALYFLTYIHQGLSTILAVCVTSSVETLALVIILQICAQYEMLIYRLNLLPELSKKNYSKLLTYQMESKILKDCVNHHIHIFSIAEKLNELFSFVIFAQYFASMTTLCTVTFQLSKLSSFDSKSWGLISVLLSSLMQIFLYCSVGETIMTKSLAIMEKIYEIKWSMITNRTKRDLIVIMIRASRPVKFMGFKMVIMSIDTFVQSVKMAFSAYNLLKGF